MPAQPRFPSPSSPRGLAWRGLRRPPLKVAVVVPPSPPLARWRSACTPILRARFPAGGEPPVLASDDGSFRGAGGMACFYDRRQYAPAWASGHGTWGDVADLLAALGDAPLDGLDSERYHLADLRRRVAQVSHPTPGDLAELDLRLTDAFLRLAADLRYGAVNPELIYDDCEIDLPEVDLGAVLESALAAHRVRPALAELAPVHAGYNRLKGALAQYRALAAAGGWPRVPDGPPLRLGARSGRAAALRARLAVTDIVQDPPQILPLPPGSPQPGPPQGPDSDGDLFDAGLQAALRQFQERHGLEPDGTVNKATLAALNVPVEQRIRQVEINLDRWRWLPRDLGTRYIMVNIAGFSLELVENGNPVLAMRVVAGKPTTRTPMFSGRMTNVVLNPYWNVPAKLVKNEVLPHAAREPGYLAKEGFEVTRNGGAVEVRQQPRPQERAGAGQVPLSQPLRRLPARHPVALAVQPHGAQLQPRLHPRREADRPRRVPAEGRSRLDAAEDRRRPRQGEGGLGRHPQAPPRPPRLLDRLGRRRGEAPAPRRPLRPRQAAGRRAGAARGAGAFDPRETLEAAPVAPRRAGRPRRRANIGPIRVVRARSVGPVGVVRLRLILRPGLRARLRLVLRLGPILRLRPILGRGLVLRLIGRAV